MTFCFIFCEWESHLTAQITLNHIASVDGASIVYSMDDKLMLPQSSSLGTLPPDKARFANAFIEAVHKLDLPEKKLLAYITFKMQSRGQRKIEITPSEMLEWSGLGSHNYTYAKEKLMRLQEKGVLAFETKIEDASGAIRKKLDTYSFLEHIGYVERGGATLTLTSFMSDFIFDVQKNYTEVYLACICKFTSKYSLRMYELCKQYLRIGRRSFPTSELVILLNTPKRYARPYDLLKKALNPAIKDVNEHSDIIVKVEKVKSSRTIGKSVIWFDIKPNTSFKPLIKSDSQPTLPGIDIGDKERNDFEILMRKAGVKGDIKDIISNSSGLEAAVWYWRNILSKDVERQNPKFPNGFIRKQFKNEAKRAYELHRDQLMRKRGAVIDVAAEVIGSSRRALHQGGWKRFKAAAPEERLKMVRDNLEHSPDEFHKSFVEENFLSVESIGIIVEDRYATWIEPLFNKNAARVR